MALLGLSLFKPHYNRYVVNWQVWVLLAIEEKTSIAMYLFRNRYVFWGLLGLEKQD